MLEFQLKKTIKAKRGSSQELAQQLKEELREKVQNRKCNAGDRLPTIQDIMKITNLGYRTVSNAFGILSREGLVETHRGTGIFLGNSVDNLSSIKQAGLKTNKIFALVLPAVRTGLFPPLIHNFGLISKENGFFSITCNSEEDVSKQGDIILQLIDQKVSGVLLAPPTHADKTPAYHVRQLQENGIPVVLVHRSVESVTAPVLFVPFEKVGLRAGKFLTEQGHRRIAYFSKSNIGLPASVYMQGLRVALEDVGSSLPNSLIHHGCWSSSQESPPEEHVANTREALKWMLSLPPDERPTAIFSSYDPDAEVIYLELQRMGLEVPKDIQLTSFGVSWRSNSILRRISSVVVDENEVANCAANLLLEMYEKRRPLVSNSRIEISLGLYDEKISSEVEDL